MHLCANLDLRAFLSSDFLMRLLRQSSLPALWCARIYGFRRSKLTFATLALMHPR